MGSLSEFAPRPAPRTSHVPAPATRTGRGRQAGRDAMRRNATNAKIVSPPPHRTAPHRTSKWWRNRQHNWVGSGRGSGCPPLPPLDVPCPQKSTKLTLGGNREHGHGVDGSGSCTPPPHHHHHHPRGRMDETGGTRDAFPLSLSAPSATGEPTARAERKLTGGGGDALAPPDPDYRRRPTRCDDAGGDAPPPY